MKQISVANDIVPVGEFKTNISKWLKRIRDSGRPLVVTQNGKPAGVLLSPAEYDELVYKRLFTESVNRGLADADAGRVFTTQEVREELHQRRLQRSGE